MRGDFEANFGGYPVAAMPTGVVKGEATVQYMPTMNKLCDAQVMPSELASQVAAFLNGKIRSEGLATDWTTLNTVSLERYNAIKDQFQTVTSEPTQEPAGTGIVAAIETTDGAGTGGGTTWISLPTATQEPVLEPAPAIELQNPQPAEQAAELAAIVAEATSAPAIKPVKAPAK